MKQLTNIFLFLLFISCKKQLDINPQSQLTNKDFYKTASDLEQAVIACYDGLQQTSQYGRNYFYFMEVAADNAKTSNITNSGGIYGDFDLFRVTANNAVLDQTWAGAYNTIQRCNIVVNRINSIQDMPDSLKKVRIGEVKFIRALTYFNITRIWGDVPLVLKETTDPFEEFNNGRTSLTIIYTELINDLNEAILFLPKSQIGVNIGRVSKGAASTLLAKIYLTQKKYAEAQTVLNDIINNGGYQLLNNLNDIFRISNKNNIESIFEVQYRKASNGEGSMLPNLFAPNTAVIGGIGQALGDVVPSQAFIDSFQTGDLRRNAYVATSSGRWYCTKFIDASPAQNLDGGNNFMVFRYADVLLMMAETLNEISYNANGNAFNFLNQIRVRAGLPALNGNNTPNQDAFRRAVERERKYELCFENHRWFDLIRTNRALHIMSSTPSDNGVINVTSNKLLFQIPQSQIDVKPGLITQNPL